MVIMKSVIVFIVSGEVQRLVLVSTHTNESRISKN